MPAVTARLTLGSPTRATQPDNVLVAVPILVIALIVPFEVIDSIFHSLVKIKLRHPLLAQKPPRFTHLIQMRDAICSIEASYIDAHTSDLQHQPDHEGNDPSFVARKIDDDEKPFVKGISKYFQGIAASPHTLLFLRHSAFCIHHFSFALCLLCGSRGRERLLRKILTTELRHNLPRPLAHGRRVES